MLRLPHEVGYSRITCYAQNILVGCIIREFSFSLLYSSSGFDESDKLLATYQSSLSKHTYMQSRQRGFCQSWTLHIPTTHPSHCDWARNIRTWKILQVFVCSFHSAIRARLVRCWHSEWDTQIGCELLPYTAHKLGSPIRNDSLLQAV